MIGEMKEFSIEKLREYHECIFNVEVHVFDGATQGRTGNYSVDEVRGFIEKWLKTGQ